MIWKLARHHILGAIAAAFLAACAASSALRDAQDAFNTAASLDNRAQSAAELQSGESGAVASSLGRDAAYAAVIERIDGMTWRERSQLASDKLLGNALTLRVLSLWRLGRFDDARADADKLLEEGAPEVAARDRALLEALPGLIRIEEAYIKTQRPLASDSAEERGKRLDDVQILVLKANEILDAVRGKQPPQEPVVGYLLQAQLAAHTNLLQAYTKLSGNRDQFPESEKTGKYTHYCALQKFEDGVNRSQAEKDAVKAALQGWESRLGLDLETKPCS
jgi:hypothetical protein